MASLSIVEGFFKSADKYPQKTAIIWNGNEISYSDAAENVQRVTSFLQSKGVKKGDRIVFYGEKSPLFAYCYLAIHYLNAIAVPVDVKLPKGRLESIIEKVTPSVVIHPAQVQMSTQQYAFDDQLLANSPQTLNGFPNSDDIADILFTTGTTGSGKGVQLTHRNIISGAENSNAFIGNNAADTEIIPLPLHHAFGLRRLRTNLMIGGTVVLIDGFLFPKLFFDAIDTYGATGLCMVPAGFSIIKKLMKDRYISFFNRLKYIEFGSSAMSISDKKELTNVLPNTRICMHYGLTEVAANIFIEFNESKTKLESIGKPSPNVDVKILDNEGKECATGDIGEISVKGDIQTPGYWKDDELTKKAIIDGWFKTGDLGFKDADGFVFLSGRNDDVMNIGGKKVFPGEIEVSLGKHPHIKDCACISIKEENVLTGQKIKAFVVLEKGKELDPKEFIQFLTGKIEPYKIPRLYEEIEKIPMTNSGKKQRDKLKG